MVKCNACHSADTVCLWQVFPAFDSTHWRHLTFVCPNL
jgi:hypothetical protein